jgi:DNA-binding response OmpR family regulator
MNAEERWNTATSTPERQEDAPEQPRHRPMVMMVEDDPDDRWIYGTILCYNGFDVLFAPDRATALQTAGAHRPDLIVMDLSPLDPNGLDLCRSLNTAGGQDVPMIALSGLREGEMGPRAMSAGFRFYIEKPTHPLGVLRKVEELLGRAPSPGVGPVPRLIEA